MKISTQLAFVCALVSLPLQAQADVYTYPSADPVVSITFPDNWKVEPDEGVLHAYPKDESIYFGFIPLPEGTTSDEAGEAIGGAIDSLVTDFEAGESTVLDVNNLKLFVMDATGKEKESGDPVNVSMIYFSPDDNPDHLVGVVYFGTDDAEDKHEKEIKSVIKSIKNPKKTK